MHQERRKPDSHTNPNNSASQYGLLKSSTSAQSLCNCFSGILNRVLPKHTPYHLPNIFVVV